MSDRWRHHRIRDHFGAEDTKFVVLEEDIGPWIQGTPVHWVLVELMERLISIETTDKQRSSFTCDAVVIAPGSHMEIEPGTWMGMFSANAVIYGTAALSFTINARITAGSTFTVSAWIAGRFTIDAVVV